MERMRLKSVFFLAFLMFAAMSTVDIIYPGFFTYFSKASTNTLHFEFPTQKIVGTPFSYYNPGSETLNFTLDDLSEEEPVNIMDKAGKRFKIILFWNDFFKRIDHGFGIGHKPFVLAGCPVNTCVITADRNRYPLSQVDALVWHLHSSKRALPTKRYPHTRYIFFLMEPPFRTWVNLSHYKGVFNMTFTYRTDSDIQHPHDRFFLRSQPLPFKPINYAKGKTKMAAQFVSNCASTSGRKELLRELQKWISVDVYGKCGNLRCAFSSQSDCMIMLEKNYKFYFAFENSLCKDYVSYKFYRALRVNIVPVVWGMANYSAIAPPHSYINALDFPSPHDLAKYLLYLNFNDTAYNEYFRWKRYYYHKHPWLTDAMSYCNLCEQLHKKTPPKSYDINKWWRKDANCIARADPKIKKYLEKNKNKV